MSDIAIEQEPKFTLADIVDQYMMLEFNDKRTYYANHLLIAEIVWCELFLKTLFTVKQVVLPVFYSKEHGFRVKKPKDLTRLLGVSAKYGNVYYPLIVSTDVPTDIQFTTAPKNCQCKDKADLCSMVESKVETRTEIDGISGAKVILKTYYKTKADGIIKRYDETLAYDSATQKNVINTTITDVATVEMKPCGCIKDTPAARATIKSYCGCSFQSDMTDYLQDTFLDTKFGYYNYTMEGDYIHLKPASDVRDTAENFPETLMVSYQSNGRNGLADSIVPEFARTTIFAGMNYYGRAYRKTTNRLSMRDFKVNYKSAIEDLQKFLNPIDLDFFSNIEHKANNEW